MGDFWKKKKPIYFKSSNTEVCFRLILWFSLNHIPGVNPAGRNSVFSFLQLPETQEKFQSSHFSQSSCECAWALIGLDLIHVKVIQNLLNDFKAFGSGIAESCMLNFNKSSENISRFWQSYSKFHIYTYKGYLKFSFHPKMEFYITSHFLIHNLCIFLVFYFIYFLDQTVEQEDMA